MISLYAFLKILQVQEALCVVLHKKAMWLNSYVKKVNGGQINSLPEQKQNI